MEDIVFNNPQEALSAQKKLSKILVDGNTKLFEEIDNRGNSLFVVLTFSDEINKKTHIIYEGGTFLLKEYTIFVAIKNGEHQNKGFAYFSEGLMDIAPTSGCQVSKIHNTVLNFFDIPN